MKKHIYHYCATSPLDGGQVATIDGIVNMQSEVLSLSDYESLKLIISANFDVQVKGLTVSSLCKLGEKYIEDSPMRPFEGTIYEKDGKAYTVRHSGEMAMNGDYIFKSVFVVLADIHGSLSCFTKEHVEKNFVLISEPSETVH
jgi:hypothetical protein